MEGVRFVIAQVRINKILEKGKEKGRQEFLKEITDWETRKAYAEMKGEAFNEPSPIEKARGKE